TIEGNAGWRPVRRLARSQMFSDDVPYRLAVLFVDGRPAGHLVALAGFKLATVLQFQLGDAVADTFGGCAGVEQAAGADHGAALLVIGIGVEEVVADVFED